MRCRVIAKDHSTGAAAHADLIAVICTFYGFSPKVFGRQFGDHYAGLLKADGVSVYALFKAAYQSRDRFQKHIDELTAAEADVDRELIAKLGESDKLKAKITAEQKQLEERRRKILEEVF